MKLENNYNSSWKENMITKTLANYVKKNNFAIKWNLDIIREHYLDDYQEENSDPDKAPRIDIRLSQWNNKILFEYFIEAKNLCENDWFKENGSKVSASVQLNRYINKGVKHFLSNYYPSNGCMCGYILNGNTKKTIAKLNNILKKKSTNQLKVYKPINNYDLIYTIKHNKEELINLFFDFEKSV